MARQLPDRKALLYGWDWATLPCLSLSQGTGARRSQTAKAGHWYLRALPPTDSRFGVGSVDLFGFCNTQG